MHDIIERRRLQRKEDGEARRKTWTERFGDTYGTHSRDLPSNNEMSSRKKRPSMYYIA